MSVGDWKCGFYRPSAKLITNCRENPEIEDQCKYGQVQGENVQGGYDEAQGQAHRVSIFTGHFPEEVILD